MPLDPDELLHFNEEKDRKGVIYLSRVPPMMGPQEIRNFLVPFGEITRVYLAPADKGKKKQAGRKLRGMFTEGWVEFRRKRFAKDAAFALNGTAVGGKRTSKYYGELWAIKYLSKFKWDTLTEQLAYDRATRDQKMRTEIAQAKREAGFYLKQVERSETNAKIEAKKAAKRDPSEVLPAPDQAAIMDSIRKRFRQRKPIQQT